MSVTRAGTRVSVGTHVPAPLVVGACFLVAALEGFDIQAFGVAAPKLVESLHLSSSQQGYAASIAMFGLVVAAFLGGYLADHTGRRSILVGSVLTFGIASALTASAHTYPTLLGFRLLTGFGFGGALPNIIAIAAEISEPKRRGFTTSAMFCGMPIGGATVALLVSLAGSQIGWQQLFLLGGILPLILAPALWLIVPESTQISAESEENAANKSNIIAKMFGDGRLMPTLLFWTANFLTLLVLYLLLNWLPTLVVASHHTAIEGANAAIGLNLLGALGGLAIGFTCDHFGHRRVLVLTYSALSIAIVGLAYSTTAASIFYFSSACGFFVLGAQYSLYGVAPALYPEAVRGVAAGAAVSVGRVGSIVGPFLAGQLRQAGWPPGQVFLALAPVAITAAFSIFFMENRRYNS